MRCLLDSVLLKDPSKFALATVTQQPEVLLFAFSSYVKQIKDSNNFAPAVNHETPVTILSVRTLLDRPTPHVQEDSMINVKVNGLFKHSVKGMDLHSLLVAHVSRCVQMLLTIVTIASVAWMETMPSLTSDWSRQTFHCRFKVMWYFWPCIKFLYPTFGSSSGNLKSGSVSLGQTGRLIQSAKNAVQQTHTFGAGTYSNIGIPTGMNALSTNEIADPATHTNQVSLPQKIFKRNLNFN